MLNRAKEAQKKALADSEAKSKEGMAALEAAAKAELDEWHAKNDKAKAERATRNAEDEAAFIAKRDETTPGNEWERVAFLLDLTGSKKGAKDTSRMKSMLIQLKSTGLEGRS